MSGDTETTTGSGLPRWLLPITLALSVALVVGVLIAARVIGSSSPGPLALSAVPAPDAASPECRRLLDALPGELQTGSQTLPARELVEPGPPGAVAWGEPAIVLRCGIPRPAELTRSSRLLDVSGVSFLELSDQAATSWIVVDRDVYVALTAPAATGSGPLQQLSSTVSDTLPRREVDLTP